MVTERTQRLNTRAGYADLIGFDDPQVKLYTHKPIPSQGREVGDVVMQRGVRDPKNPSVEEMAFFIRKQKHGMFTWTPEECMTKAFYDSREIGRGQEKRIKDMPAVHGCRWCRSRNNGSEGAGVGSSATSEQPSQVTEQPGPPPTANEVLSSLTEEKTPEVVTKAYPCPLCDGGAETETGFKTHMTLKHTSTPKKRGARSTKASAGRKEK